MFLYSSCTIFGVVENIVWLRFYFRAWLWLDLQYAMLECILRFLYDSLLQVSAMEKEWIRLKNPKVYLIGFKTLIVKAGIYKFQLTFMLTKITFMLMKKVLLYLAIMCCISFGLYCFKNWLYSALLLQI